MSDLIIDPIDVHRAMREKKVEVANSQMSFQNKGGADSLVDLDILKSASKAYHISPNIEDYVVSFVPMFPLNIPNRNGLGFSLSNVVEHSWEYGRPWYKTWVGMPAFYEHQNDDETKANGIILDVSLRKDPRGWYKNMGVVAHDRSKYRDLIQRVANKELSTYSMGAYVLGGYVCSVCGRKLGSCVHLKKGDQGIHMVNAGGKQQLAFRVGLNPKGFEISLVETPAWSIADNNSQIAVFER